MGDPFSICKMKLYELRYEANNGLVLLTDLDYFHTHFIGKTMLADWRPPKFQILGKSKPVRDFVSWMTCAPVVSEKAKNCLKDCLGDRVEFLPLIHIKNKQLFAINVLNFIDCLDVNQSDVAYSSEDPARIITVYRYVFDPSKIPADPVIFKVPQDGNHTFISRTVVDIIVANQLTGSVLVKPGADFLASVFGSPDVLRPV
jgi:hypothetical protein